ncbi:hypothetical protein CBOM_03020 [Ceraceosorus bombacis]|uniref:Uncharacterized protein n=1 Tax=Ceraceosorus bombacis TaxID=401625 RepID=A0A0P1BLC3_9BASI|nr:hypothetical protein CBOM_03020 [Ceraceosorus bombacis]
MVQCLEAVWCTILETFQHLTAFSNAKARAGLPPTPTGVNSNACQGVNVIDPSFSYEEERSTLSPELATILTELQAAVKARDQEPSSLTQAEVVRLKSLYHDQVAKLVQAAGFTARGKEICPGYWELTNFFKLDLDTEGVESLRSHPQVTWPHKDVCLVPVSMMFAPSAPFDVEKDMCARHGLRMQILFQGFHLVVYRKQNILRLRAGALRTWDPSFSYEEERSTLNPKLTTILTKLQATVKARDQEPDSLAQAKVIRLKSLYHDQVAKLVQAAVCSPRAEDADPLPRLPPSSLERRTSYDSALVH